MLSAPDFQRGAGQGLEGAVQAGYDQAGRRERQQQGNRAPAEPLQRRLTLYAFSRQSRPVFVIFDTERYPEAGDTVALDGKPGLRSEQTAHLFDDHLHRQHVRWRCDYFLVIFHRVDADTLAFGQLQQQVAALCRLCGNQGRSGEVDHAGDSLCDLMDAWSALIEAENLEPRQR